MRSKYLIVDMIINSDHIVVGPFFIDLATPIEVDKLVINTFNNLTCTYES